MFSLKSVESLRALPTTGTTFAAEIVKTIDTLIDVKIADALNVGDGNMANARRQRLASIFDDTTALLRLQFARIMPMPPARAVYPPRLRP